MAKPEEHYKEQTRAVAMWMVRVYLLTCFLALVVGPLSVWGLSQWVESDAALFGLCLVIIALFVGVPLLFMLTWQDKQLSRLRAEFVEDQRAYQFQLSLKNKEGKTE